jgi:putative nucleotidyltransferase with HDIG domain
MASARENILDYARSMVSLPRLGTVTRKVSIILSEEVPSFSQLFDVVRYDPGLSSRIISAANSAWYDRGVPVVSLMRAMTVIGLDEVKNSIVCAPFYDGVLKKSGLKKKEVFALWKHSVLVAFGARTFFRDGEDERDKAFVAGLLHDIGKVPLQLLYHYDISPKALNWEDVCAKETDRFGVDHQTIGFHMATEWKLPEEYRQTIRLHHDQRGASPLGKAVRQTHLLLTEETDDEELAAAKKSIEDEAARVIEMFA